LNQWKNLGCVAEAMKVPTGRGGDPTRSLSFTARPVGLCSPGELFIQRERVSMAALVLSRKKGESIEIGNNIVVTVVELTSGKVRLQIKAPIDVMVYRKEVADAIRRGEEP
jgi:carbon storage regulator